MQIQRSPLFPTPFVPRVYFPVFWGEKLFVIDPIDAERRAAYLEKLATRRTRRDAVIKKNAEVIIQTLVWKNPGFGEDLHDFIWGPDGKPREGVTNFPKRYN